MKNKILMKIEEILQKCKDGLSIVVAVIIVLSPFAYCGLLGVVIEVILTVLFALIFCGAGVYLLFRLDKFLRGEERDWK